MKTRQDNPRSLTRRLSVATLALAALTPLAAAMAQAPEITPPPVDSTTPELKKDAAHTADLKTAETSAPAPVPTPAEQALAAANAKAAAEAAEAAEAAKKKCEEDKPKNPCAPRRKKKC